MFRVILHLDMDAFYASVEQRENPALRGKPLVVGAPPTQRGVVAACSHEARKFGVRSAMPSAVAKRLCPDAIFVHPRMTNYKAESAEIMKLVAQTGGLIEQVSIDEAYIDLSSTCQCESADSSLANALPIASELKRRIFSERKLTTSIGLGANKFLAKVASDYQKPNGLTLIKESEKVALLRPMPVRAIHGVGKVTEEILKGAGIHTIADLQNYSGNLRELVGSFASALKGFAFGEDDRPLEIDAPAKSISSETTFLHDTDDRKILRESLREQAAEISEKLKRNQIGAQTVQVKIRYGDFTTLTRQFSVEELITEAGDIYRLGCYLLAREKLVSRPLRLIGLGVSGLGSLTNAQLALPLSSVSPNAKAA
jgi:DNA polymerase-4